MFLFWSWEIITTYDYIFRRFMHSRKKVLLYIYFWNTFREWSGKKLRPQNILHNNFILLAEKELNFRKFLRPKKNYLVFITSIFSTMPYLNFKFQNERVYTYDVSKYISMKILYAPNFYSLYEFIAFWQCCCR